jgi:hypothetical protein
MDSNHIINYEKNLPDDRLFRPLSVFDAFLKTTICNRGLALCHGHNHSNEVLSKIRYAKYWYMVDNNPRVYPDYVANVCDINDMMYFPDNYFDAVASIYTPTFDNNGIIYDKIFGIIHRIIKWDGFVYLTELPRLFFHFINDVETVSIMNRIYKMVNKDDIENFRKSLLRKYSAVNDHTLQMEIFTGNYRGPRHKMLNQNIRRISIEYTKPFLRRHHFQFIRIERDVLIAKPIKN